MSFYLVDVYFILLDVHNGNNLLTEIIEIFARSEFQISISHIISWQ
jgi:hypothetical protein